MNISLENTSLDEVKIVKTDYLRDERGFFIESYHKYRYAQIGLQTEFVQDNHSRSARGVLRGLHYQDMTAPMAKLVRCTRGAIFDVAVDLRVNSPTFGKWFGLELTEQNQLQLFIPIGFGHGFVALTEVSDVQYKCSSYYAPQAEGAVMWNDPQLAISWPIQKPILSRRDEQAMTIEQYLLRPAFLQGQIS